MKNNFMYSEGGSGALAALHIDAANGMIRILLIDGFSGIGGLTGSAKRVEIEGNPAIKVIAAINHNDWAISTHMKNNPDVAHFKEDIRKVSMKKLQGIIDFWKLIYPHAKVAAWFSSECTHISNAKGGQSRDADSRTLSRDIYRYIDALNLDYIFVENVKEIMSWGPLRIRAKKHHKGEYPYTELKTYFDKKAGKELYHMEPWSKKNGLYFQDWINTIKAKGYNYDYRLLDSADYGAFTSRERYFAIFAKPGLPIVFPKPTHERYPKVGDLFDQPLQKWNAVEKVLDLTNHGYSIFYKKGNMSIPARNRRDTCDASFDRYYDGLIKHICGGKEEYERRKQFLIVYHGSGPKSYSLERPSTTIPTNDSLAMVTCEFYLDKQYTGNYNHQSVNVPAGTILQNDKHSLMTVERFIYNPAWFGHFMSTKTPSPVIVSRQDKAPVQIMSVIKGENVIIPVYEGDSPSLIRLKELMALYSIVDIKMRMLSIPELLAIMGFDRNMILTGPLEAQKSGIGNAVEGVIGTAILQEVVSAIPDNYRRAAA